MNLTLLTLALSLPAAPAPVPRPERPEGPPPRIVTISPGAEGQVAILQTVVQNVAQQRTVQVTTNDGRVVPVTQTVMVPTYRQVSQNLALENVEIYGHDGKKLERKDVKKLLTRATPALLSADGKPVDRFYLRLVREGTLVLVLPASAAKPGGGFGPTTIPAFPAPSGEKLKVPVEKLPREKK